MNKTLTSFILLLTITTSSLYSPRADALVGWIFKSKVVKVIGGVGAIGGGVMTTGALVTAVVSSTGGGLGALLVFVYGSAITGLGLIILDDNELADIEFRKIELQNTEDYLGFSAKDVAIYNSEIELLNAVRQTIVSEVSESESTEDAEALWLEYADVLNPVTFEIAKAKAKAFVEAL